jgi:hypothetical protein
LLAFEYEKEDDKHNEENNEKLINGETGGEEGKIEEKNEEEKNEKLINGETGGEEGKIEEKNEEEKTPESETKEQKEKKNISGKELFRLFRTKKYLMLLSFVFVAYVSLN